MLVTMLSQRFAYLDSQLMVQFDCSPAITKHCSVVCHSTNLLGFINALPVWNPYVC